MNAAVSRGLRARSALAAYEVVASAVVAGFAIAAITGRAFGRPWWRGALERLGAYRDSGAESGEPPVLWMHAASVGEVGAASAMLQPLREELPGWHVLLTCQTATGKAAALANGFDEVRYFPIDSRCVVRRVLANVRPAVFVFAETEIWPRLLLELAQRGIPAAMVNARVSARAFGRYRRVRSLFAPSLATIRQVCARDRESLTRLIDLGAAPERSSVCGDLKLDAPSAGAPAVHAEIGRTRSLGSGFLLAVSTHEGEEPVVLDAFARVRERHPGVRVVLAPRHPRRCDDVTELARPYGRVLRWSSLRDDEPQWDILVVDTVGEIPRFLAVAACAFVGGSLVGVGGHNLAEPARFGVPIATGSKLGAVKHQADLLADAEALRIVDCADRLAQVWMEWIEDPSAARATGARARAAVESARGAVGRTMAALGPLLARAREARDAS